MRIELSLEEIEFLVEGLRMFQGTITTKDGYQVLEELAQKLMTSIPKGVNPRVLDALESVSKG